MGSPPTVPLRGNPAVDPQAGDPQAGKSKTDADAASRRWRARILVAFGFLTVAALTFIFWPQPELDLAAWLAERDLELNVGFAGHYLPGTVVRTHRSGPDGTPRKLARPEIVLWPEQCFPGKTPRAAEFPLPQSIGRRSTNLKLESGKARDVLPALGVEGVRSWRIEIVQPRILTFAEADLARQFSDLCLDRLEPMFDAGTDPASMATILEAVVADGLRITVDWQTGIDGKVRTGAALQAVEGMKSEKVSVETKIAAEEKTVLAAEGRVVVAYRVAAMAAVTDDSTSRRPPNEDRP